MHVDQLSLISVNQFKRGALKMFFNARGAVYCIEHTSVSCYVFLLLLRQILFLSLSIALILSLSRTRPFYCMYNILYILYATSLMSILKINEFLLHDIHILVVIHSDTLCHLLSFCTIALCLLRKYIQCRLACFLALFLSLPLPSSPKQQQPPLPHTHAHILTHPSTNSVFSRSKKVFAFVYTYAYLFFFTLYLFVTPVDVEK